MKLTRGKLLKAIQQKEDKIIDAIQELQDFLDSTEDSDLSSMGAEFNEVCLDFLHENDLISLNDIKRFIEEDFEES